jgi:hypothetical protein
LEATNLIEATKSTDLRGVGCSGWLLLKYLPTSGFALKKIGKLSPAKTVLIGCRLATPDAGTSGLL